MHLFELLACFPLICSVLVCVVFCILSKRFGVSIKNLDLDCPFRLGM